MKETKYFDFFANAFLNLKISKEELSVLKKGKVPLKRIRKGTYRVTNNHRIMAVAGKLFEKIQEKIDDIESEIEEITIETEPVMLKDIRITLHVN